MALDASIYHAFGVRPKSIAEFDAEAAQREQNQLALLAGRQQLALGEQRAQEYQQGAQEKNALRALLGGGVDVGTPEGQAALYRTAPTLAPGILKERAAAATEAAKGRHLSAQAEGEAFKNQQAQTNAGIQRVLGLTDSGHAASDLDAAVQAGKLPAPIAEAMKRSLPQDPAAFPTWKLQMIAGIADPAKMVDMLRPHLGTVNAGGTTAMVATDPLTGRPVITGTVAHTQTPDNAATNARAAADAAAGRAVTVRGQDLTDARSRDALAQKLNAPAGKPLPTAALKMQQEALDAIGTAGGINADLGALNKQLADGKLKLGLVSNALGTAANYVGASTENSANLASFKATLEKLRNDSLRLNKGVQTEGDAQRAWGELVANINDKDVVQQRLGEIQKINERAAALHRMNVDTIRANYGAAPLDTEGRSNLPPAVGGGASGEWEASPGKTAGKAAPPAVARVSSEADYHALPSGAEYLDPDGKRRRKK